MWEIWQDYGIHIGYGYRVFGEHTNVILEMVYTLVEVSNEIRIMSL
jgi:hypothetical protein